MRTETQTNRQTFKRTDTLITIFLTHTVDRAVELGLKNKFNLGFLGFYFYC